MTCRKKLIEVALPLEDINREAAREKSIRHGHPSTLHLWWARRPLAACRAVLFASLVDDPSERVEELLADAGKRRAAEKELKARHTVWIERKAEFDKARDAGMNPPSPGPEPRLEEIVAEIERERLFDIIRELVKWENSNDDRVLGRARAEIMRSCNGSPPPVYDPFCGGGSIPLEAQRLGLEAHASDLNPVPVLITKALIEIPPRFAGRPPVNPESRRQLLGSPASLPASFPQSTPAGKDAGDPGPFTPSFLPASSETSRVVTSVESPEPHLGWHSRGYLPHWDHPGMIQSLGFRLHDAVPKEVIEKWRMELDLPLGPPASLPAGKRETSASKDAGDPSLDAREIELLKRIAKYEDASHGACWLRDPRIAELVENALLHFDGQRYRLIAWCIMPNHVHAMIETFEGHPLDKVIHSWKSYTASEANKILGRSGTFWLREYHDRYIRNAEHYRQAIHYIEENPVKAGLAKLAVDWRFSSARRKAALGPPASLPAQFNQPPAGKDAGDPGSWTGAAGLAEDIRYYGQWMRDEAEKRIGHLYPKVKLPKEHGGGEATVIAWLWARTVASPNPAAKGAHVPLAKSFWLSAKAGKKAWIEPVVDQGTMTYQFAVKTEQDENNRQKQNKDYEAKTGPTPGTVNRNGGVCLLTGSPMSLEYVRAEGKAGRLGVRMMAIVAEGTGGRVYLPPSGEHEQVAQSAKPAETPTTDLPKQALGFRVQAYGMTEHKHLFTDRQLSLLITLCDLLKDARSLVARDSGGEAGYADAVITYLGIAISKLAAFHCGLGMWRASDNKTGRAFGRQAISMVWDFPEANPFADAGGELEGAFESLGDLIGSLPASPQSYSVQQDATVAFQICAAAISTDPPYYDNVPYADLSDFFYIWLRRALNSSYPDLFKTVLVPKQEELIAEPFRHGSKEAAQRFFEEGMGRAFDNVRAVSLPEFPVTVYYAFKQTEDDEEGEGPESGTASTGWETMLEGLVTAGFSINGTWPMRTEQAKALKGTRNALASSIVLVCRPRPKDAGVASRRDFLAALKRELPEALRNLQKGNIAPVDLAQAAIGPGMAVFSRYSKVLESDGSALPVRTALGLINRTLDDVLAEQEGEFEPDTRWALAWFDQHGFAEGPYGTAEVLCTAKATSMKGMEEAGILVSKGGKVRLLHKEQLLADWDPATDDRFTTWEGTHHLCRALEAGGVEKAAQLVARLASARAETARDLAYRLYSVCERRKWAQDAITYNNLVIAWPEIISRLAETGPTQQGLEL